MTVHVTVDIQLRDVVCRGSFEPNSLPDATARRVEDVTWPESLLSNGNHIVIIICGIMNEDKPAI